MDLSFDAVADDGLVIAGQPVKLSILAVNRGAGEVESDRRRHRGIRFAGGVRRGSDEEGRSLHLHVRGARSKDARLTTPYFSDNYWKHPENPAINVFAPGVEFGVPFQPTPFPRDVPREGGRRWR